jgi:DNA-binding MarR family transcriptional regulator
MEFTRTELVTQFVDNMEQFNSQWRRRSPGLLNQFDLTMPQAKTLFFLSHGDKRMSEIAEHLGRGMPAVTSKIDRLVKKGLVERAEDATDRRVVACRLTDAGREAVEQFWRLGRERTHSFAEELTDQELEIVIPALEILAEAARRNRESEQTKSQQDAVVASSR